MNRAYILLLILLLGIFANAKSIAPPPTKQQCREKLEDIFKGLSSEEILNFVHLQTSLSTHKFAWAHLQNLKENGKQKIDRESSGDLRAKDTFEKSIVNLLEKEIESIAGKKGEEEHKKAKELFEQYTKSLTPSTLRQTLDSVSPSLRNAILNQLGEKGKPSIYKINASDLALVNLLAKGEESAVFYSLKDKSQDKRVSGNTNIARMINSSMRGKNGASPNQFTSDDVDSNLEVFKSKINELDALLKDLVHGMLKESDPRCFDQKLFCSFNPLPGGPAEFFLASDELMKILGNEIESRNKTNKCFQQGLLAALEYCNNWMSTDAKCQDPDYRDQECSNCSQEECVGNKMSKFEHNDKTNCDLPKPTPLCPDGTPKIDGKECPPKIEYCSDGVTPKVEGEECPKEVEYCPDGITPKVEGKACPEIGPVRECPEGSTRSQSNPEICETLCPDKKTKVPVGYENLCKEVDNPGSNTYIIDNSVKIIIGGNEITNLPPSILPIIINSPGNRVPIIIANSITATNPGTRIISYDPNTGQITPIYPPGGTNPGGLNPGGTNPGGTNPGGNNTDPKEKKKETPSSWGISLTSKVDKLFNPEGEDLFTVMTVGEKEYDNVCIKWTYPSDLKEMNRMESYSKSMIKVIRAAGGTQTFSKLYAPYRKSSYKVSVTLAECSGDNELGDEIQTSTVEIKRAWQGGSFSCDWNPANINLKACLPVQSNQVPFRPLILNGTDYNQGF